MVLITIYSGWRPQEIAILKRENIDLEKRLMTGGIKTRAGIERIVPIHDKIFALIKEAYEKSEGREQLFNDDEGQQGAEMTYDKYRGRFNKVMKFNHLEGYTPHCGRVTFVTRAKEFKVDEYAIKYIVGHEINDITEKTYTKRHINFLIEEMSKIK